jgi:hypothetical protein
MAEGRIADPVTADVGTDSVVSSGTIDVSDAARGVDGLDDIAVIAAAKPLSEAVSGPAASLAAGTGRSLTGSR